MISRVILATAMLASSMFSACSPSKKEEVQTPLIDRLAKDFGSEKIVIKADTFTAAEEQMYPVYGVYVFQDFLGTASSSDVPNIVVKGDASKVKSVSILRIQAEERTPNSSVDVMGQLDIVFKYFPRTDIERDLNKPILTYDLFVRYKDNSIKLIELKVKKADAGAKGQDAGYGIPWESHPQ